ncbi:MAG: PD-(D/E)XK nuclease family protein [Cyanobacteria bacterium P01_D01_bin.56]
MTLPVLSLSQTHLALLETCPRRFQYIFDQSLTVPSNSDGKDAALWGNQFHLMMHQQALGLPIEVLAAENADMAAKVNALRRHAPHLFQAGSGETFRQSEHQRTLALNGYVFTVVYDLLVLTANTGLIVDWKTYLKPPKRQYLANDWQTRLYLYVLAETSELAPEQLTMSYWFVRHQDEQGKDLPPSDYRFAYSLQQHDRTRQELLRLTETLSLLRQASMFPKTDYRDRCLYCPFQIRCQRVDRAELPVDLDAIDEISIN